MANYSSRRNKTEIEGNLEFSSSECIVWLTVSMTQSVAIVTLNLLTIIVFVTNRSLRKRSMYLLINLAVADLLVGGFSEVVTSFVFDGIYCNFWKYNLAVDVIWDSIIFAMERYFLLASITNLAAISLERMHATFRPFKHRLIRKWVFGIIVVGTWMTAGVLTTVISFFRKLNLIVDSIYVHHSFLCICLFIIFVSYAMIVVKILNGAHPQRHGAAIREKKLTKTLLIVTVVSLMLWLPDVLIQFIYFSVKRFSQSYHLESALRFLHYTNSFVNPILYAFRMPEFKRAMLSLKRYRPQRVPVQVFPLNAI